MFSSTKIYILLACSFGIVMALPANDVVDEQPHIVGGAHQLSGDDLKDAEKDLEKSLIKLADGPDGPNYKISKVYSGTKQVVAGTKLELNVDLIDKDDVVKNCDITKWSRPWLDLGIEVTFECKGEEKLVKNHSA